MRARKYLLLYCADETMLSVLRLVIDSKCLYAVTPIHEAGRLTDTLALQAFDAALVVESPLDEDHAESVVRTVCAAQPDCRVILDLLRPVVMTTLAQRVLLHNMIDLLEALQLIFGGRRKWTRRHPPPALLPLPGSLEVSRERQACV
jgi:hypothetical protein